MEALAFFFKIQDRGYKPDNVTHKPSLGGLCRNHCVDKALPFFQASNGLIPYIKTYNFTIYICLRNKKYNEACELVEKMVNCGFLADAFTTALLQQLLSNSQDPALLAMRQKCLHSGI